MQIDGGGIIHDRQEARQFATFSLGKLFFGIDLIKVQELLRFQEMTVVPLAPQAIVGLINLRGQIVTAVDTRRSLGLEPADTGELPMNIVIRSEDGAVSLLVDEIGDVVSAMPELYSPVPENMPPEQKEVIEGVYKLPGHLLLVLDTERLLQKSCN